MGKIPEVSIAAELHDRLERVANLLGTRARATAREHGVEPVQLEVLRYLSRCNRYSDTGTAVTEYFGLTKGTVSQTLAALHRKGLVDKVVDEHDGRVMHLSLTRAGDRVVKDAFPPELLHEVARTEDTELVAALEDLLLRLQHVAGANSFNVCQTCAYFRREGDRRFRCGLTGAPLRRSDIVKICREHVRPGLQTG